MIENEPTDLPLDLPEAEPDPLTPAENKEVEIYAGEEDQSMFTGEQQEVAGWRDKAIRFLTDDASDGVNRLKKGVDEDPAQPGAAGAETPPPGPDEPTPTSGGPEDVAAEEATAQGVIDAVNRGKEQAKVKDYGPEEVHARPGIQHSGTLNLDADDVIKFETEELTDLVGTYAEPKMKEPQKIQELIDEIADDDTALKQLAGDVGYGPKDIQPSKQFVVAIMLKHRVVRLIDELVDEVSDPATGMANHPTIEQVKRLNQLEAEYRALDEIARGAPREAGRILRLARENNSNDILGNMVQSKHIQDMNDLGVGQKRFEAHRAARSDPRKRDKFVHNSWGSNLNSAMSELYRSNLLMNIPTLLRASIGSSYMMHIHMPVEKFAMSNFSALRRRMREVRGLPPVDPNADPLEAGAFYKETKQFHENLFKETLTFITNFSKGVGSVILDAPQVAPKVIRGRGATKIDDYHEPSITGEKLLGASAPNIIQKAVGHDWVKKGVDIYGRMQRTSFGLLSGMDGAMKGHMYNRSLHNYAMRMARNELLQQNITPANSGNMFDLRVNERVQELVNDPPTELVDKAMHDADRAAFTQRNKPGMPKQAAATMSKIWGVVPFRQTPVNIMDEVIDLAIPTNQYKMIRDWPTMTPAEKDAAWGRTVMAMGAWKSVDYLLSNQAVVQVENPEWLPGDPEEDRFIDAIIDRPLITGAGPRDKTAWANLYATGWRPFSFYVPGDVGKHLPEGYESSCGGDGCYISYSMFEPVATVVGMMTTISEQFRYYDDDEINEKEMTQLTSLMGIAMAEHFLDKSMMSGVSDLITTASQGGDWTKEILLNVLTSLAPVMGASGTRQLTADFDPFVRDTDMPGFGPQFWAMVDAKFPGLSTRQAIRHDRWGRQKMRPVATTGLHFLSPVNYSPASAHPEDIVVQRHQVAVRPVQHTQVLELPSGMGDNITLKYEVDLRGIPSQTDEDGNLYPTNHVFQDFVKMVGEERRRAVVDYVFSKEYREDRAKPEYDRTSAKNKLRLIISQARSRAIQQWLANPDNTERVRVYGKVVDKVSAPILSPHLGGAAADLDRQIDHRLRID